MLDKVLRWIRRHGMFSPGDRVAVAVSGGSDSVALLYALLELAPVLGIQIAVAHLNHRLRGEESDADEEFVTSLAAAHKLTYLRESIDVGGLAERTGENIEQAARNCRYQWFARLMRTGAADKVAVGHTLSDQAETVLLRFFRGSGSAGLAGVLPVRADGVVRPLLGVTREQARNFLEERSIPWRDDSSNLDQNRDRNRLRHHLMPLLLRDWNPNLPSVLGHMAEWARDEEEYWGDVVAEMAPRMMEERGGGVEIAADLVTELPKAAARRVYRHAIDTARGTLQGIGWDHVEQLWSLGADRGGRGELHLPGLVAVRSFGTIRLESTAGSVREWEFDVTVDPPASIQLPGRGTRLVFEVVGQGGKMRGYNDSRITTLDWERVPRPLRLRSWRPGDSYRPQGRSRSKKLKALFQESRTPIWEREGWPVLTVPTCTAGQAGPRERIVWSRVFGVADDLTLCDESRHGLQITEVDSLAAEDSQNRMGRSSVSKL